MVTESDQVSLILQLVILVLAVYLLISHDRTKENMQIPQQTGDKDNMAYLGPGVSSISDLAGYYAKEGVDSGMIIGEQEQEEQGGYTALWNRGFPTHQVFLNQGDQ